MKINSLGIPNSDLTLLKNENSVKKTNFKDILLEKIKEVDTSQKEAKKLLEALAKGEDVDFSEIAIAMTKADLDLRLLLRIRNKILDAYQEIMRMQI